MLSIGLQKLIISYLNYFEEQVHEEILFLKYQLHIPNYGKREYRNSDHTESTCDYDDK